MAESDYVLKRLDVEWRRVVRSPQGRAEFEAWKRRHAVFEPLASLEELRIEIDRAPLDRSTGLVWELLEIAPQSELARRVLLQAIVPGLAGEVRWLSRWARRTDGGLLAHGDVDQILVLAGLEAIAHASGHRRSWPICSILRRAHRILLRETRAQDSWYDSVDSADQLGDVGAEEEVDVRPAVTLLDLLGQAAEAGAVSDRDARLLWLMGVEGYTSQELAVSLGISPRAVATRRLRAETRLAAMATAA